MRKLCLCGLLVCGACSDRPVRSGALADLADFLPMAADTGAAPRMVVRCEQGRLSAYIVVATPEEVESGQVNARAVPVELRFRTGVLRPSVRHGR